MQKKYYDLFSLQAALKTEIEGGFPDRVWIKAEISGINRKPGGHCYLELSQTERGSLVAKTRAVIWSGRFNIIDQYFKSVTGSSLAAGMEILSRVQVSYHVLYGLTLTIDEVDPDFTLGEKQLQKQRTLERLQKEGLLKLQKNLRLPLLPYSLAVVSARGAAGYGDFRHHLLDNEFGFVFDVSLFEATMQGESAPESIISALSAVQSSPKSFDAVLLMRGGGSELDLACFDDYSLAVAIARCPVPVLTAIGHDKDHHVADMVAHTFVKTPTALADLFIECFVAEDTRIGAFESRLLSAFNNRLHFMSSRLDILESRIGRQAELRLLEESRRIDALEGKAFRKTALLLSAQELRLSHLGDSVAGSARRRLDREESSLERTVRRTMSRASSALADALSSLVLVEARIKATDPRNILRKGFVLALDGDGVKMSSASAGRVGERVQMMFADGTLKCGIVEVDLKSNISGDEENAGRELRGIG